MTLFVHGFTLITCAGTLQPQGLTTLWFYTIIFRFNLSEVFKIFWTFYMLCLVGGPSVSPLSLTSFERNYLVSMAMP